jgi:hypothetical protein
LKAIESYVSDKFGDDSDLEKTVRFVRLVILYKQSESIISFSPLCRFV